MFYQSELDESMRDQINNLSRFQKFTACQIANQLHVSNIIVKKTLKDENSCLRYQVRVEYLGQGCRNNAAPFEGWFRDIQIESNMTLNGLNDFIQHVLKWDNTHCYIFTANEKHYAYLGEDDDFVVENVFENHCSTKIPIYLLSLCEHDRLIYYSDFGDDHFFLLTIFAIERSNKSRLPRVIGARGNDLLQYKISNHEEASCLSAVNAELEIDKVNSTFSTTTSTRRYDIWTVDFIVGKDKDILEKWRKSKDRRKWEIAVTILENRSMSLDLILTKIERSIIKVREWILAFNYYGMEGLQQTLARRIVTKGTKQEKMEQRKKRLVEIIHHKPKFYNINRSNWSLDSLAKVYNERFGEMISGRLVAESLKKSKYTIKKARRVLTSPDPDYREKVDILLKTLSTLGPDELLFFIDELGPLKVRKYGGRTYSRFNETPTYPQNQLGKGSISLAGALSATTNQMTWMYIEAKDSVAMINLAEVLYNQYYSKKKLYITWDCASWHRSHALVSWLELFNAKTEESGIGPIIEFIPLPTCAQFLDIIESVFSGMKRAVIHNSDYQSETEMKTAISHHFRDRNEFFKENPKRAGNKIWEIDFFQDHNNIKSGTYREW